jgi:ubiquinone/menaquinone biosynthesis C-methylase UbiE
MSTRILPTPPALDVAAEWIDPHLATVFARWHDYVAPQQRESALAVIEAAGVLPGHRVIDIGCGSGVPSLTIAERVGPAGSVVATDPSPASISAVAENARRQGLTNLTAVCAAAASLPFDPESFDAATCHMGVMFFPDLDAGLRTIRRVLRHGRRAAFVAWGPVPQNELFRTFWSVADRYLLEPRSAPPPGAPEPMRFAQPGSLGDALRSAGFADVSEETRTVTLAWPGDAAALRDFWFELTALHEKVAADRLDECRAAVAAAYVPFARDGALRMRADVVVASGRA